MFAYGAGPCRRVDLVTGPGNIYTVSAKRLLKGVVGIDSEAGPTEIAILADDTADPAFVAADLVSQAEHDPSAQSILVTDSADIAREVERDILPTAQKYGIGVLPWSPLAGGWLSGRYRRGEDPAVTSSRLKRQPARHDPASPENKVKLEAVYALQELADEAGLTMAGLAVAWVLQEEGVSAAIVGASRPEQLKDVVAASGVRLDPALKTRLDEVLAPVVTTDPSLTASPAKRP